MTAGCLFTNFWYFYGSTAQTDQAMELAIESIGERARNQLVFVYWIPQLFTGYLISGLRTGAYNMIGNETMMQTGEYDAYFGGFAEVPNSDAMFSIYVYNVDDNIMMGAWRKTDKEDNSTDVIIRTVTNNCVNEWIYSPSEGERNSTTKMPPTGCRYYDATSRGWYNISQSLRDGQSQWSEPTFFDENRDVGMSLVTRLIVDGIEYIFLAEINREQFGDVVNIPNLPEGASALVLTSEKSVVSTTNGDIELINTTGIDGNLTNKVDTIGIDAQSRKTLDHFRVAIEEIVASGEIIEVDDYIYRGSTDEYMIQAFSFYMMYVDFFDGSNIALNPDLGQVGFIVISYDQSYLNTIKLSFYLSWGIFAFMIFVSCSIVCLNVKSDQQEQKDSVPMGVRAASIGKVRRTGSLMAGAGFLSTANLMQPHHSNQSFITNQIGGGTVRRRTSKLRDMSPMPRGDANGAIEEEDEFEDDDESDFSTTEEEKDDNGPIKTMLSNINEEDENEVDEFSMQKDEDQDKEDENGTEDEARDKFDDDNFNLTKQPDMIAKDRSGTGAKSLSPEESHHFDARSTEQAMMIHARLNNKSATEDAGDVLESRNDTDVLDTIYDNVIEHSNTDPKIPNRPFESGGQKHSAPIIENEEMTPKQLGHKYSKDTVLSNSASPKDPNATAADDYITPPTAPMNNDDNVLNLPTSDSPHDDTPEFESANSGDSTAPLKGEDDALPDKNPPNKDKKTVSFHMEIDSTAAKLPPPGPDGDDTSPANWSGRVSFSF